MRKLIAFFAAVFLVTLSVAQPPPPPPDPDVVPITGIELLLAAGAAFGVKRIIDIRKSRK